MRTALENDFNIEVGVREEIYDMEKDEYFLENTAGEMSTVGAEVDDGMVSVFFPFYALRHLTWTQLKCISSELGTVQDWRIIIKLSKLLRAVLSMCSIIVSAVGLAVPH